MKRALVLLLAATLTACNLNVDQPTSDPSNPATETFDASLGVNIGAMTMTPTGAYYKDIVTGTGATLTGQPIITFTYIGFVKNGATFGSGQQSVPYSMTGLVYGLQEGMQGMRVGGQRLIVIPSTLGYGAGVYGPIPPNSTLIYRIQLDGIFQ